MDILLNLLGGAVGGNVAGALFKNISLGTALNSVLGILGGGIGGQILSALGVLGGGDQAAGATGMDIGGIVTNILSSGVGGGILMALVGFIKGQMKK